MTFYDDAQRRIPNQQEKILAALRDAGADGVTNKELSKISLQYSARIHELLRKGNIIDIEKTEDGSGLLKYILRKETGKERFFETAEEEILNKIDYEFGGSVNSLELKVLLNECHSHIVRRANWYKEIYREGQL
jgi:hypothetical protein